MSPEWATNETSGSALIALDDVEKLASSVVAVGNVADEGERDGRRRISVRRPATQTGTTTARR